MVRNIKPIIYIFCEGATEEKYFIQLSRILGNTSFRVKTYDLEGGTKIKDHPERIKRLINSKLKHDKITLITQKVFVIFDLDIFNATQLQNTQNVLKDFELIVSNMNFEYWILSHFEKYNLGGGKSKYLGRIKKYIIITNDKFTGRNDYDWLNKENIELAILHVKGVNVSNGNLKSRDPYSEVYKIIEFLEN